MNEKLIFLGEPEKWFYDQYDYLMELAEKNEFNKIPSHVKVYFVIRVLFDEVMNGGFGQFASNSSRKLNKYLLECAKTFNNKKLIELVDKYCVVIDSNYKLTHEDSMKLETLSNDFYDIEDEYDLYDLLDDYFKKHNK